MRQRAKTVINLWLASSHITIQGVGPERNGIQGTALEATLGAWRLHLHFFGVICFYDTTCIIVYGRILSHRIVTTIPCTMYSTFRLHTILAGCTRRPSPIGGGAKERNPIYELSEMRKHAVAFVSVRTLQHTLIENLIFSDTLHLKY